MTNDCGGCQGLGAHKRWCPWSVGAEASRRGGWSESIEAMADRVGANNPIAANHLYRAAALLLDDAKKLRAEYQANPHCPECRGVGAHKMDCSRRTSPAEGV